MTKKKNPSSEAINPLDYACVSKCTLCPALSRDHVPSFGDPNARLFIVGQTPDVKEVERKLPFVGTKGALLDLLLSAADLQREEVYMTNAVKCHPPGDRPAAPDEIVTCRNTWLLPELRIVLPKLVLVLGKDAFKSLSIPPQHWGHGNIVNAKTKFLISFHPSYFLRRNAVKDFISLGPIVKELLDGKRPESTN